MYRRYTVQSLPLCSRTYPLRGSSFHSHCILRYDLRDQSLSCHLFGHCHGSGLVGIVWEGRYYWSYRACAVANTSVLERCCTWPFHMHKLWDWFEGKASWSLSFRSVQLLWSWTHRMSEGEEPLWLSSGCCFQYPASSMVSLSPLVSPCHHLLDTYLATRSQSSNSAHHQLAVVDTSGWEWCLSEAES